MPKLSKKRQITLPAAGCKELGISAGDEVEILYYNRQFTVFKKELGSAAGVLASVATDETVTEKQSMKGNFE